MRQFFFELFSLHFPRVLGTSELQLNVILLLLFRALGNLIVEHLLQVGHLALQVGFHGDLELVNPPLLLLKLLLLHHGLLSFRLKRHLGLLKALARLHLLLLSRCLALLDLCKTTLHLL